MKTTPYIFAVILTAFINFQSNAQIPGLPNPSSTQTITQELGLGKISINYSRPNTKGRKIFGNIVPYGKVWRTGANTSTSIHFSEDVSIAGHNIPAGAYTLYTIPEKDEWTVIMNKTIGDWGAYAYKEANDFIRFNIKPVYTSEMQETFTIQFSNSTAQSLDLSLIWDHTKAIIHIKSDDDDKIMANIDQIMSADDISNLAFFNAIQYYYINHKDIDKALGWIEMAEKKFPARGSYKLFKSNFLLRKGDKAGAISSAQAGIKVSEETHDDEYLKLNQTALELARK